VSRGDAWLGPSCFEGAVWYFAFEGRRRDVRAHFRQMGARRGDLLSVFVGQAPLDVGTDVRRLAEEQRPVLIIIDTMQRFLRATSTDDYAEMTTLLDAVIGMAQQSGATIVLLHHSAKADRASIDAVLGSTAITGSADSIILLRRNDRYRTIETIQRVGGDLPETVLLLDEGTGRVALGGPRADADRDLLAAQFRHALATADAPLTREELLEKVEGRRQTKLEALKQMLARHGNQIVVEGKGTRNDPRRYSLEDSDSGSQVPSKEWEPEIIFSSSTDSSNDPSCYSGSRVPAQGAVTPRTAKS
jgi:AAA domain